MQVFKFEFALVDGEDVVEDLGEGQQRGLRMFAIKAEGLLGNVRDAREGGVGGIEVAADFFGDVGLLLGQINEIGYGFEGIIDFVSDGGGEASEGGQPFAGVEDGFDFLLLSDVAKNFGGADDVALSVLYGRNGERNIEALAIFFEAYGLKVVDALASLDF